MRAQIGQFGADTAAKARVGGAFHWRSGLRAIQLGRRPVAVGWPGCRQSRWGLLGEAPYAVGVARYLVVANQTLGGTALARIVAKRAKVKSATFHVAVPATEPADEYPPAAGTASENAQRRLQEALERLKAAGVQSTGEVGAADPMQAIRDALRAHSYSGFIISTLPPGVSRWLHMDLPHRVAREFNLPVELIEARTDAPDEATISRWIPERSIIRDSPRL